MSARRFVDDVLDLYVSLPDTRTKPSRQDRRLAASLHEQAIPFAHIRAAMLIAAARRTLRRANAPKLPPIGCLHYFLPVLDEVNDNPPDPDYVRYLEDKLRPFLKAPPRPSTTGQKTALSPGR